MPPKERNCISFKQGGEYQEGFMKEIAFELNSDCELNSCKNKECSRPKWWWGGGVSISKVENNKDRKL